MPPAPPGIIRQEQKDTYSALLIFRKHYLLTRFNYKLFITTLLYLFMVMIYCYH
jgi:hypothetical protein